MATGSSLTQNYSRSQSEIQGDLHKGTLWMRFQRTGDVTGQPVSGQPRERVTTPRQDRYLAISARRQRGSTARAQGSALTVATGIRISRQTVYRRLNHAGLDEVLEPYVRLFRGAIGPDFIFMDDNAPCHRAVLIDDFLETENIQRMSWPANSPDLNPIEHVWDMLGRQIAALSHPPSSVTELKRALQEAWNHLSP
ncbi:transposable element Tcb2 transposase [Trichonephila clavipes]|nr:transposable element Tcb2 transposase [Trichonephila clavipes]